LTVLTRLSRSLLCVAAFCGAYLAVVVAASSAYCVLWPGQDTPTWVGVVLATVFASFPGAASLPAQVMAACKYEGRASPPVAFSTASGFLAAVQVTAVMLGTNRPEDWLVLLLPAVLVESTAAVSIWLWLVERKRRRAGSASDTPRERR